MSYPRVGIGVFVWKENKFLMGKRLGKHGQGSWSVPGGHLEFGETWQDCAKREIAEETGLTISHPRLVAVTNNIFENEKAHSITIWMDADWVSGQPQVLEPDKFVELSWHTFQDLPTPLFEPWRLLKQERPDLFAG